VQTHVSFSKESDVGYLTFACEVDGKPTTLDLEVLGEFDGLLDEIADRNEGLRAVVVRSSSKKYFVVGANVNALEGLAVETIIPWVQKGHDVFNKLEDLRVPVIARVEGFALGGGLELAMACDLIAAGEGARFGQPEAKLGFVPGWGGSYRLPRRVGVGKARELCFTGKVIEAEEARSLGLVDFAGADVDGCIEGWIEGIGQGSRVAISEMKRLLRDSQGMSREESGVREGESSRACMVEGDTLERIREFLESRHRSPPLVERRAI
jgi:enoyl-CoA hydratase